MTRPPELISRTEHERLIKRAIYLTAVIGFLLNMVLQFGYGVITHAQHEAAAKGQGMWGPISPSPSSASRAAEPTPSGSEPTRERN